MTTEEPKKVKIIRRKKVSEIKSQIKCDVSNCEDTECSHYELHDKMDACEIPCGIHSKAKCIRRNKI